MIKISEKYISIKKRELEVIESKDNESSLKLDPQVTIKDLFRSKFLCGKLLRARIISSPDTNITSLFNSKVKIGHYEFKYDYQRQGFHLTDNFQQSDTIYPLLSQLNNISSHILFTSSGQTANYCIQRLLNILFPDHSLLSFNSKKYHETHYLNLLCPEQTDPKLTKYKVAQFDGAEDLNVFYQRVKKYISLHGKNRLLIWLDSTCFSYLDKDFFCMVNDFTERGIMLFITRSHIKLDCFGSEYSLLGSIQAINHHLLTKEIKKNKKSLPSDLNDSYYGTNFTGFLKRYLATIGGFATFDQVYPFMGTKNYYQLTHERVLRIKKNTDRLFKAMQDIFSEKDQFSVSIHPSKLFLILKIKNSSREKVEILKIIKKIFTIQGCYLKICDSFGFDFFNATLLALPKNEQDSCKVRIASGDQIVSGETFQKLSINLHRALIKIEDKAKVRS